MEFKQSLVLGTAVAIGGLCAQYGYVYGAYAAAGLVLVVLGGFILGAIKEQTAWLREGLQEDLIVAAANNESVVSTIHDLSKVPSERVNQVIFGEAK